MNRYRGMLDLTFHTRNPLCTRKIPDIKKGDLIEEPSKSWQIDDYSTHKIPDFIMEMGDLIEVQQTGREMDHYSNTVFANGC